MTELLVKGVSKVFGRPASVVAIEEFEIALEKGELLVLLGPSGCGKTTALRCIGGLETPTAGRISIGGKVVFDSAGGIDVPVNKRDIGMVFQNYALWPHMNVSANVEYPLLCRTRIGADERERRVTAALDVVRCGPLGARYPAQLSGGQQQRVALARALVAEPALVLLDEPLSNLDALLRAELRVHLQALHRRLGFTGVYVTHDQLEALNLGDRVAVMSLGRIRQLDTPKAVYARPATSEVASFLGVRNALTLTPDSAAWRTPAAARVALAPSPGAGDVELKIRPEDLRLRPPGAVAESGELWLGDGSIESGLFSGGHDDHVVTLGGTAVFAASPGGASWRPGACVGVFVRCAGALIYRDGMLTGATISEIEEAA